MDHPLQLSGHLWNAVLLAAAALVALAAERMSADPAGPAARRISAPVLGEFTAPVAGSVSSAPQPIALRADPLETRGYDLSVARGNDGPTVNTSRRARQLTAILIADDRPVAVIDGSVVKVGDTLPDGARVTAIRTDRVAVMERNGQHRVLTMSPGGP